MGYDQRYGPTQPGGTLALVLVCQIEYFFDDREARGKIFTLRVLIVTVFLAGRGVMILSVN